LIFINCARFNELYEIVDSDDMLVAPNVVVFRCLMSF
jgi:hypothetical protein